MNMLRGILSQYGLRCIILGYLSPSDIRVLMLAIHEELTAAEKLRHLTFQRELLIDTSWLLQTTTSGYRIVIAGKDIDIIEDRLTLPVPCVPSKSWISLVMIIIPSKSINLSAKWQIERSFLKSLSGRVSYHRTWNRLIVDIIRAHCTLSLVFATEFPHVATFGQSISKDLFSYRDPSMTILPYAEFSDSTFCLHLVLTNINKQHSETQRYDNIIKLSKANLFLRIINGLTQPN